MASKRNISLSLILLFVFIVHKGLSLDLHGPGITTSQSSTVSVPGFQAWKAVDRDTGTSSHTAFNNLTVRTNPWWKVDLGAVYCLRKITLVNRIDRNAQNARRLYQGVVRAGLSPQHLQNPAVGQPVAFEDAVSGAVLDFLPDPYVTARYVSVDINRTGTVNGVNTIVNLVEVMIEEVTMDTIKIDTPSSDKALTLTGLPSSQSSTWDPRVASRAVDGSLMYGYSSGHMSSTRQNTNPWWKIDLTSVHCIETIAVRNPDYHLHSIRLRLQDGVVRAGLSATHLENPTCGSAVTLYQALINDWIEFPCPPYTLAQYVSVDIPRWTYLQLAEVMVWPCDLHPTATNLANKPSSQSSTEGTSTADRAIDSLPTDPNNYCSLTTMEMDPWWMVDLESSQCLGQIRVWNSSQGTSFQDVVVRVGLSSNHTDNIACGRQVQASSDFVESTCDPPILARYVSIDIPGMAQLGLCEVTVATCDFTEKVDVGDLAVVVNPSLLGATGDNNSIIAVHRGPEEITSNVSFGRQVSTGGSSGLPSGSGEIVDPSLGCSVRLLRLPEQEGLNRTGVLYAETTRNGLTTRIQTVILPKDGAHIRPVMRTQTASIGDSVVMDMLKVNPPTEDYRWRRDGGDVIEAWNDLLRVSVSDVAKEDEGVYSCFILDQEDEQLHGIMRLIVRACPSGRWDPPSCLKTCRRCYNGGVCDDQSGTCVCAPGFSGDSCVQVHGRAVFGKTAELRCSNNTDPHNDACRGRLFCLSDPYGCSCAAGYMGLDCMQECAEGRFGADCKQTCHCASGSTCSKDTGECSIDCEAPYFGRNCQCTSDNGILGLEVTSGDPHQLLVAWQPDPCSSGYEVTTRDDCGDIVPQEAIPETTYHFITGLESTQNYSVSIRPLYPDDVKGPKANFPPTSKPTEAPTEVNLTSMTSSSLNFSWGKPPCGSRGGVITGYTYMLTEVGPDSRVVTQSVTSEESVTIKDLSPLTEYSFRVAAETTAGAGPYSEAEVETTLQAPKPPPNPGNDAPTAAIGGAVAGIFILILVIVVLVVVFRRRRRRTKSPSIINGQVTDESAQGISGIQQESSSKIDVSEEEASVCPKPPSPWKPKPEAKPHPAAPSPSLQPETKPSPAPPVSSDPILPDNEEELPYAEVPIVREADLAEYIERKDKKNGFHTDFKTLPKGVLHPATVAEKPENKKKNRYVNVVAYDYSRVVLEKLEGDPHSDYINACYVDGYKEENKYIASQGPNKGSGADMWRMVWQYDVDKIIMLTNPVENGKVKCEQYWPSSGSMVYADIMIKMAEEKSFVDYTVRSLNIHKVDSDQGTRLVTQFHFKTWPDMEPPEHPTTVLNFLRVVNAKPNEGRTVVHCSAGIGRTGTYIALDAMLKRMQQEGCVDVLGFIYRMRQKRNKMVQTAEQYRFVYDALLAALLTGDSAYNILDYQQKVAKLKNKDQKSKKTGLGKQYETLGTLMKLNRKKVSRSDKTGKLPENVHKNRFPDFPALEHSRAFLMSGIYANESNNYINATFLPGYRRKNMYISTQMPMPNTVNDFLKMVYERDVSCIVMLNLLDPEDETMCPYWPEEKGGTAKFGPIVVELTEMIKHDSVTERRLTLHNEEDKAKEPRTISQYACLDWPSDQETPNSVQGMLTLMSRTLPLHDEEGCIVVHCIDGMGRSAVYCAVMAILEQSKEEKVVDLFQAVFRLRIAHFNMVYCVEFYELCYQLLQKHLDSAIYANL